MLKFSSRGLQEVSSVVQLAWAKEISRARDSASHMDNRKAENAQGK